MLCSGSFDKVLAKFKQFLYLNQDQIVLFLYFLDIFGFVLLSRPFKTVRRLCIDHTFDIALLSLVPQIENIYNCLFYI